MIFKVLQNTYLKGEKLIVTVAVGNCERIIPEGNSCALCIPFWENVEEKHSVRKKDNYNSTLMNPDKIQP